MGISIIKKNINGHMYYYARECQRVDGRPRIVWQKYLGKLEDIVATMEQGGAPPDYAEVFEHGLSTAMWRECCRAEIAEHVDGECPKRKQGLSVGEYIAIAAINRAMKPVSKKSMWEWFTGTSLLRYLPGASSEALASQRFWDHMDKIDGQNAQNIYENIITGVLNREQIDLSSVSYDGTNFYTFIDTFNTRCTVAKRGKNKQGRCNLRQVGFALFCSSDGHIPLMYDVYDGNRNDSKQFKTMLTRFGSFMKAATGRDNAAAKTTLIFDKGNNSEENLALVDSLDLGFVGSVRLDQVKDLASVSNKDPRFLPSEAPDIAGTRAFRTSRVLYGKERTLLVTYNQNLFHAQWLTVDADVRSAMADLEAILERLAQRASGTIKGGNSPTLDSIKRQCAAACHREHVKDLIQIEITETNGCLSLSYAFDADAMAHLSDTNLGKNILVTNRAEWSNDKIIQGYRSQYVIEDVFKEMKDRQTGNWWPQFHWTDSKIKVHGLYCTIALLLRALAYRRVRNAGERISMKRMLSALADIREVVNVFKPKRKGKEVLRQVTLTKTTELQKRLLHILDFAPPKSDG